MLRLTRSAALTTVAVLSVAVAVANGAVAQAAPVEFRVHEWGVWVRSTTTSGTMWASPDRLVAELPPFVRFVKNEYEAKRVDHGWDKPVIHLYGPEGLKVKLSIGTRQGRPAAYYPAGKLLPDTVTVTDARAMMIYALTDCFGIEWSGTLASQPKGPLPPVDPKHWWSRVRKVPSAYIRTRNGQERFLFYEATAFQEPVVIAEVLKDRITLRLRRGDQPWGAASGATDPLGSILVIVNDGVKHWLWQAEKLTVFKPLVRLKADLLGEPVSDQTILTAARKQWRAFGMTEQEAAAIVDAWREDLLGKPGFLVISRMPGRLYDQMFPLEVTPKPKEIVRVGLVFDTVPGSKDRLGWLPGSRVAFETWLRELGDANAKVRKQAFANLAKQGDLVRPMLEKLPEEAAPTVRYEVGKLLELMRPRKVKAPLEPSSRPKQFFIPRGPLWK